MLLCLVVGLLVAGCSGINASKSISPLDFILPGLIKADPPMATNAPVVVATSPFPQLAQAR